MKIVALTRLRRFSRAGFALALGLLMAAGGAHAERDQREERLRGSLDRSVPQRGREGLGISPGTPSIAPGGLRHRDYPDQRVRRYDEDRSRERSYRDERQHNGPAPRATRPVDDVIRQVERSYGGKVVGVQQEGANYRVRVLQRDGRVKTVMMPAQ